MQGWTHWTQNACSETSENEKGYYKESYMSAHHLLLNLLNKLRKNIKFIAVPSIFFALFLKFSHCIYYFQ